MICQLAYQWPDNKAESKSFEIFNEGQTWVKVRNKAGFLEICNIRSRKVLVKTGSFALSERIRRKLVLQGLKL